MKTKTASIALSLLLASNLFGVDNKEAQESLVQTLVKKHLKVQNIKGKTINKKRIVINQDGARVMVRLKRGISVSEAYESIFKNNKHITKSDVMLVKSFPLAERKVSKLSSKKNKKYLLVLKSKKLSEKDLLKIGRSIKGAEVVEISRPVSINTQVIPNDEFMSELWGMHNDGSNGTLDADIDAPEAWSHHVGNKIPVIGIIDTGIDYYHQDLRNNIWINEAELHGEEGVDDDGNGYVDDVFGIDVYNYDSNPFDDNGHGTHVAGTIGAEGNNTKGVVGVNWHARMAGCKFLSYDGWGNLDGAVECVNYFTMLKNSGVNIVATNNSWGGGGYSEILEDTIENANAAGILFIAAAGNDENDNDASPSYPASYDIPNVLAVAATNSNDELAWFSNYGATSVDLAAPGQEIKSTLPSTFTCQRNGEIEIYTDSFENGDNNWSMLTVNPNAPLQDYPNEHWQLDTSMASEGNTSLSDSKDGDYNNNRLQTAMLKNTFDLSNWDTNKTLCVTMKIKGATESGYDPLFLAASPDGGENWYIISERISGSFDEWTEIGSLIPSWLLTDNFKIAVVRLSDGSITSTGYNIDEFGIGSGNIVAIPNYGTYSGTSMATPHVTGAVALLSSLEENLTIMQIKNKILSSVDVISSLNGLVATGGRLNINNLISDVTLPKGVITFDDISDNGYGTEIPSNYGKFNWSGFYVLNVSAYPSNPSGYLNGMVSANNVAYNGYGNDANISSTRPFNFKSAYLTGAWNNELNVTVQGYKKGVLKYTKSTILSVYHPTKVDFNFDDVDNVVFHSEGGIQGPYKKENKEIKNKSIGVLGSGNHFVIDNVVIEQNKTTVKNDFNGDGISDFALQRTNGNIYTVFMNSDGLRDGGSHYVAGYSPSDYEVVGTGDFNGDGISDIFVQRLSDGRLFNVIMKNDGTKDTIKGVGTYDRDTFKIIF